MSKSKQTQIKKKQKNTGVSINRISFFSFLMFVIILLASLYFVQEYPLGVVSNQRQIIANAATESSALKFTRQVETYSSVLQGLAKDPALINIFSTKNLKILDQRATELRKIFPKALRVRLLLSTTKQPDTTFEPHFTYACLDLLNLSREDNLNVQVEMHEIEGKQQHIDIMQAVTLRGTVVGFIQLAVDSSLLDDWTKSIAGDAYLEIHQKIDDGQNHLISNAGSGSKRGTFAVFDVPGTHWQIETWAPYKKNENAFNIGMFIVLGVGMLLLVIVVLVYRQILHKQLLSDLEKYLALVTATFKGAKNYSDNFCFTEFQFVADQVKNVHLDQTNLSREQDAGESKNEDSEPEKVTEPEIDPIFLKKDAIEIEEIDDEGELDDLGDLDDLEDLDDLDDLDEEPESEEANESSTPVSEEKTGLEMQSTTPNKADLPILPEEMFKAYDIRGIVGKTLTVENILFIGHAIGSEAKARGLDTIVFARDGRLSGPKLGKSLVTGLMASGMKVIDIGLMPTPVLYYAAAELSNSTGVMLTGSHNPPNYNGIKMVLGGDTLSGDVIQSLRQRIIKDDLSLGEGSYSNKDVLGQYIKRITGDIKLKRKMKVVIDCGNGVAGVVAPQLFEGLGCEVTLLYCDVDGSFPNHHPDPSQPENLIDLIAEVKKQNADLGLAFDGDGDRIGVVSSDGSIIWPDRLMMLFAKDVLSRNPGADIIYDIKCSSNLHKVIEEEGGKPLMWKTGHSLVKAKMKETKALLAGEMSGHIFFKERWYGFDDALYSAARLLEILAAHIRQARVVFADLPDSINTPELKVEMEEGENFKFMKKLIEKSGDFKDAKITLIDGIRVDYSDGWGLVRASNTTPCLVLRFEGKNKKAMTKVQGKFRNVLKGLQSDIKLPF